MRSSLKVTSLLFVFSLGVSGCLSPLATHRAVLEYDRTVSYVEADLLLLNIARARYHRPVHFTAVSSVAATFDFRTDAGIRGGIGHAVDPTEYPVGLEYGVSVAENPTITIIPITGEEFTKRILHPLGENTLRSLVHQGYELNMLFRLMARGFSIEESDGRHFLINRPSEGDGFIEFRRRLLHLASLEKSRSLYIEPLLFNDTQTLYVRPPDPREVVEATEKGYRWEADAKTGTHTVWRPTVGRLLISNYDSKRLSNEERRQLHLEAIQYPESQVLVDIRPGYPGGDYPLHGTLILRSINNIIGFVGRNFEEDREFAVAPDPRTRTPVRNPVHTLEVVESATKPEGIEFAVQFEGRWYSLRKYLAGQEAASNWNQEAFAVLSHLFQMAVTDLGKYPTPAITIQK
ncbi:MAG: hypothetical protein JSR31_08170 [Nitrospira sp.]|nr:hypothetical protein [Nitrospira sp.]